MYLLLGCSVILAVVGCVRTTRVPAADLTRAAPCDGYEDILILAERPYTPCEVDTPVRAARWPTPYAASQPGPCKFAELQLVVDSLGRLEPGSPSVIQTNDPAVAATLVRELANMQFEPGRRLEVPVRQIQRIYFGSKGERVRCTRGDLAA